MQSFGNSPMVMENIDQLYAYLKGRSDGAITRAKVEEMPNDAARAACRSSRRSRWPRWRPAPAAQDDAAAAQGVARLPGPEQPAVLERQGRRHREPDRRAVRQGARPAGRPTTRFRSAWPSSATRCATSCPARTIRCDIVMGVPAGFDQVSVTKPYYRSTYALVFPQGQGPRRRDVAASDFLALDPAKLAQAAHRHLRPLAGVGVARQARAGRAGRALPDHERRPEQYPGEIIEQRPRRRQARRRDRLGPDRRLLRASACKTPELVVVPLKSEPGVQFDYQMAMGVRYGEREWKQQIEALIDKQQAADQRHPARVRRAAARARA